MKQRVERFLHARGADGGFFHVEACGDGSAIVCWRSLAGADPAAIEGRNLQRCADSLLGAGFRFRRGEDHLGRHIRVTMGGRA